MRTSFLVVGLWVCLGVSPSIAETTEPIDRDVWSVIVRTVTEDDIEGMATVYHPDAVLVNARGTVPLADQFVKWGRDMEQAASAGARARVEFRFSNRQIGETTAFETGMFRYTTITSSGEETDYFVPFEALLVKKGGKWAMLMERQLAAADEAAWDKLE